MNQANNLLRKGTFGMRSDVLNEVSSFRTLEAVLQWAFARKPQAQLLEVVTQDEFTHDVIIRVADDCFLVFDTN